MRLILIAIIAIIYYIMFIYVATYMKVKYSNKGLLSLEISIFIYYVVFEREKYIIKKLSIDFIV